MCLLFVWESTWLWPLLVSEQSVEDKISNLLKKPSPALLCYWLLCIGVTTQGGVTSSLLAVSLPWPNSKRHSGTNHQLQELKSAGWYVWMCSITHYQSRHTWFVIQYLPFPPSVHRDGTTENLVSVTGTIPVKIRGACTKICTYLELLPYTAFLHIHWFLTHLRQHTFSMCK